jgi:hypothetical protein
MSRFLLVGEITESHSWIHLADNYLSIQADISKAENNAN